MEEEAKSEVEILSKIIKQRRSIFPDSYSVDEVPDEVIRQILESANYAPTHKLTQPWRFMVFRKNAKARLGLEMARLYQLNTPPHAFLQKKYESILKKVSQSSCIICLNVELHPDKVPEWEELAALACAVQNMSLTAQTLSVGSYWSSPAFLAELKEYLNLDEREKCYGLLYMGYHDEKPREAVRKPIEEKTTWLEI